MAIVASVQAKTPGRRLSDLLRRDLDQDPVVTGVTADSRKVGQGTLFCALPGVTNDGRDFIPQALAKGAAAVLAPDDDISRGLTGVDGLLVKVSDVRRACRGPRHRSYRRLPQC